jgi:NDP-sugar pyrophosphorylase family protein
LLVKKDNSLLSSFIGHKYETNYYGCGIYFIKTDFLDNIDYSDDLSLEDNIIIDNFDKVYFIKLPENIFVIDYGTHENFEIVNNKDTKYGRFFSNIYSRIIDKNGEIFP